ncbi:MAG: type II toxin-antitoxin system RelE/ParE family toxin [Bryobacteraceae bacterium]
MPKKSWLAPHIASPARRDIAAILKHSSRTFGEAASRRYEALILQAVVDLVTDPERPGSKEHADFMMPGVRTYHLDFSRTRMPGPRVKEPRHFLVYRIRDDRVVEVARILHDSRDLERHVPEPYRLPSTDE